MLKILGKSALEALYYTMWGMLGSALTLMLCGLVDKIVNRR